MPGVHQPANPPQAPALFQISEALKAFYVPALTEYINTSNIFTQLFGVPPAGAVAKVWEWPGAIKWRKADGTTFITPRWRTANVAHGQGNRARRRMGWTATYTGSETWRWIPPKKKPRR